MSTSKMVCYRYSSSAFTWASFLLCSSLQTVVAIPSSIISPSYVSPCSTSLDAENGFGTVAPPQESRSESCSLKSKGYTFHDVKTCLDRIVLYLLAKDLTRTPKITNVQIQACTME